jgi:hypothetical protein
LYFKERKKFINGHFDTEPFEVLRDMLRVDKFSGIGGPPQLLKVYEHMNRQSISVKWKIGRTDVLTLLARRLKEYEKSSYPIIDPDTLKIEGGSQFG